MTVQFDLLRAAMAVYDTGSFCAAASRLNVTQSAISHQIKRLEDQLGSRLFERTTRRLSLTEEGHELVRYAQRICSLAEELDVRFGRERLDGVVRIGASSELFGAHIVPSLARFSKTHPNVRLDVRSGMSADLHKEIDRGTLDLAVVMELVSNGRQSPGKDELLVWAVSNRSVVDEARPLPLALFPEPCFNRNIALTALAEADRPFHIVLTSPNSECIRAAVVEGLAVSILTLSEITPEMRVVSPGEGLPRLPTGTYRVISNAQPSAAVTALKSIIEDAVFWGSTSLVSS